MALLRLHLSRPPLPSSSTAAAWSWGRRLPSAAASSASSLLCSSSPATSPLDASASAPPSIVGGLLDYLNEPWTQFHATAEAKRQLLAAGFNLLSENDDWDLQPSGRYFFTRNMSCLVAFVVGERYRVGNGFNIIASHTDSPCLKLKPRSASFKSGHQMVNVQTYGGGLWHTWFDRDLTLAGRVILKAPDGSFKHKLVKDVNLGGFIAVDKSQLMSRSASKRKSAGRRAVRACPM